MIRQQELTWDGKAVALNQRTGCRCKGGELEQNKVSKLLEHVTKKAPLKKTLNTHSCCSTQRRLETPGEMVHAQQFFLCTRRAMKWKCGIFFLIDLKHIHPSHSLLPSTSPSCTWHVVHILSHSSWLLHHAKAGRSCLFSLLYLCTCR